MLMGGGWLSCWSLCDNGNHESKRNNNPGISFGSGGVVLVDGDGGVVFAKCLR
jgi:hypothetical protein